MTQGHLQNKSRPQVSIQDQSHHKVDQASDQDLNFSHQQLHVTFPNQMLEDLVSALQQKALIGRFSSVSLSFLDIKTWAFKF